MACSRRGRGETSKEFFTARCGCMRCCQAKRPEEEATPELEEVVVDQPRSASPEPEPAIGGRFNIAEWVAEKEGPKEETKSEPVSPEAELLVPESISPSPESVPTVPGGRLAPRKTEDHRVDRPMKTVRFKLEEVAIDQPKSEPPSPEPKPATSGWLGGGLCRQSEATESVGESSV
ncbi:MAG: hypothetical protein OXF02_02285 [Simkaniaceae bacterium]|nr:hypothetical protein [Simkaniaceae bacterium]